MWFWVVTVKLTSLAFMWKLICSIYPWNFTAWLIMALSSPGRFKNEATINTLIELPPSKQHEWFAHHRYNKILIFSLQSPNLGWFLIQHYNINGMNDMSFWVKQNFTLQFTIFFMMCSINIEEYHVVSLRYELWSLNTKNTMHNINQFRHLNKVDIFIIPLELWASRKKRKLLPNVSMCQKANKILRCILSLPLSQDSNHN